MPIRTGALFGPVLGAPRPTNRFPMEPFRSPPFSTSSLYLSGVTRDSGGAALGSCTVDLFTTQDDRKIATTTSDPTTGAFSFQILVGGPFYLVAYKAGAPDVGGTTLNTLVGA